MMDLGKYTVEVLSAYAVTLGLLAVIVLQSLRRSAKIKSALATAEAQAKEGRDA